MPRDYKHVRRTQERRRGAPGWLWALAGLSVGLFVALLVYLDAQRLPTPRPAPAVAPSSPQQPAGAPQAPGPAERPAAEARPRFEFYTILPEMEESPSPGKRAGAPPAAAAAKPGESYLLQVGAFRTYEDADRLKASLALHGLEATIQSVSVAGKATLHRVRVGPFSDMGQVNDARRRLREQSLEPIVVRGKG
jgi:cell division protein FtsN